MKLPFFTKSKPPKPGGIYYGWVVVIASLVIGIISFGIRYSFGIFFTSLENEFGLSRAATSGIFSAYMLIGSLLAIGGGWAIDKYGPKKVAFITALFTGLSLLASSQVQSLWQLYITYSLLLAIGTGSIFTLVNSTASRWFVKKRGFAVGITSTSTPVGQVLIAPIASLLITNFDWRQSFIILGLFTWLVLLPMSRLLKRDPAEIGLLPDNEKQKPEILEKKNTSSQGLLFSEALRTREFWLLVAVWGLTSVSTNLFTTHSVPHAIDLGITPINAAFIVSLAGIGGAMGRLGIGKWSDKVGRKIPGMTSGLIMFGALIWLIWITDLWMFFAFALVFGYGWGGISTQSTAIVADIFGVRRIGIIMGSVSAGFSLGAAIGPALGGIVFDATGTYTAAFLVAALGMLTTIICFTFIRERAQNSKFQVNPASKTI